MGLFDFLKPKDHAAESAVRKAAGNLFDAQALTTAIARNIPQYITDVKRGRCQAPACTRQLGEPRANVRDIWEDTRLEALTPLFNHGASNAMALCEPARQTELFHAFRHDRPHLKFPHVATGDEVHDTIQAVFQCVDYLRDQCLKAGTNYDVFKGAVATFEKDCANAYDWWQKEGAGPTAYLLLSHGERPPLMIYILWRETTRLAKEIATACIYGSSLENALVNDVRWAREKFRDDPKAANEWIDEFKTMLGRIRAANDPDDLLKK